LETIHHTVIYIVNLEICMLCVVRWYPLDQFGNLIRNSLPRQTKRVWPSNPASFRSRSTLAMCST